MEPISGLDASFLYGEADNSPMHVGSVAVIEGSLDYNTYKELIRSRLHLVPKLRKRLIEVPLSIDYPYWVDDPNFNLDMHIPHVRLPKPGGWKELRAMASTIFSQPLDRSRPLWLFTFVEGLDTIPQVPPGSVAIISKIHHVAIDGVAGAGIMSLLFDPDKEKKPIPPPKPFVPKAMPNELQVLTKSATSFAARPLKLPRILYETAKATLKAGVLTRGQKIDLPTAPFTAPSTPLNGIISPMRKWNTAILSLDRVKALRKIMDTKLNDIVLAICAGALRRYLLEKKQLPSKPLVAMVPISVRQQGGKKAISGNQLSMMLVQLATNIEDPLERLETIYANTLRGKTYQQALGAKSLSNLAEVVPFGVANQAARFYSRHRMAKMHNPVFNVVITNVPGPPIPIYLNGHQLLSVMGMAPIIDGMGLIITVFSYNGMITISPTSDAKSMPDIDLFTRYIRESANELEELVHAYARRKKSVKKPKVSSKAKSDRLFEHYRKYLKNNPEFLKPDSGKYQFLINGTTDAVWQLNLEKPPGTVRRGRIKDPDLTITVSDDHLYKIGTGEMNFQMAFIQGRVKVQGDTNKAMRLAKIISLIPPLKG